MKRDGLWALARDWGLALVITAVALFAWRMLAPAPVASGASAPPLELPSTTGAPYSLAAETSELVVVNFWATWCGPCRTEIPHLSQFSQTHHEIKVLGVSVDADLSTKALAAASDRLGIRYPVLHDAKGAAASAWGVSTYPTTFVLDRDHHVLAVRTGALDRRSLEELLAEVQGH